MGAVVRRVAPGAAVATGLVVTGAAACSLNRGERSGRLGQQYRLLRASFAMMKCLADSDSEFSASAGLVETDEFVAAEHGCCSFFWFALTTVSGQDLA